ncbi:MAG TPA: pyridoxal-phosphate dependent enzyme [Candidatus Berkiella sp.]|nr:pyridoxal-phosphate dependent enzyme [Candidatus Berkiella sp.]
MIALSIATPLLQSHTLSKLSGRQIYLKCEMLQPSGSFKDRGIGALCAHYAQQHVSGFISSSGGNAGLAVAYASQVLNIPAKVVVPKTTPDIMVQKLRAERAIVIVEGDNWDDADRLAKEISENEHYAYIPPFNNPIIWQGYMPIIDEIKQQMPKPDAIIVSVGGGGLYSGLVQGLHANGWKDVAIITAETEGAASLATAMKEKKRIRLEMINTVATTLGAKQICQQAFDLAMKHPTYPHIVTDKAAVNACLQFADHHRFLVEPACGAALSVIYEQYSIIQQFSNIAVILCGGSGVNLSLLKKWQQQFSL